MSGSKDYITTPMLRVVGMPEDMIPYGPSGDQLRPSWYSLGLGMDGA